MSRRTAYCVSISPRYKPVTLLSSRLAADRVTVEATSTEDAGGHTLAAADASTCLNLPASVICIWSRQHSGQSRCASGGRKNGASRSGKAIFSKEE